MTKTNYVELLQDPRWQKKRLEVLQRFRFSCSRCGADDLPLHVHHRYYVKGRAPWAYPDFALISLCNKCHVAVQQRIEAIPDFWETAIDLMTGSDPRFVTALYRTIVELKQSSEWDNFPQLIQELLGNPQIPKA